MAWKAIFDEGVTCYERGDFEGALARMNQAANLEDNTFVIYDSRAAVHEKLGNLKAALLDSKRVVRLAPDKWQGHARLAHLFDLRGKHGPVIKSVDYALSRLPLGDVQRHTQLLELRDRAAAAQADAEKRRSLQVPQLYLLGNLPMETLLEIFSILIDEDHTWSIRLSHICGHWRQILISTPFAWQTLVLSRNSPLQKAKMWKQRAKNRISRISVAMLKLDRPSVFAELKDLSWDHLWSLRISGEAFLEFHRVLSRVSIPHAFSKLGDLTLLGDFPLCTLSCCLSGPMWKLRTLHLAGAIHIHDEWWQHIQGLKELYIHGFFHSFSMAISACRANPSLEKLSVGGCSSIVGLNNNVSPIHMNSLKFVELQTNGSFDVAHAITAPSITHFSLTNAHAMVDETLLHIASRSSLVQLCIVMCSHLSPSTLLTLLSSTPNLETLQVSCVRGVGNELLQFLAAEMTEPLQGLPCRALKHVEVSRCGDLTTSSVCAFVKTRLQYASNPPVSTERCADIASLNVEGCPNVNIEAEMLAWFRSNIAQLKCAYFTKKPARRNRRRTSEA